MRKLIIISGLFLVTMCGCANDSNIVSSKTTTVDTQAIIRNWLDSQKKEAVVAPVEYYYEYTEVSDKHEKGVFTSTNIYHKGDHTLLDVSDEGELANEAVVEVNSDGKELK